MVKLTPELIEQCYQFTNAVRDRELDLRGYKVPVIENLGATLDQFDTIDFSDNEVRKLDGFPLLKRLKCLLLNHNKITRITEHLEESLPNLESLILTENKLEELGDIDNLSTLKNITTLSLLGNPLRTKTNYRLYVVHKLPHLRVLDFQKVKFKERELAAKMFKGRKGKVLAAEMGKRIKTFIPGGPSKKATAAAAAAAAEPVAAAPKRQEVEAIKKAIANAKTLAEVERLTKMLETGQLPGVAAAATNGAGEHFEEEMDEED